MKTSVFLTLAISAGLTAVFAAPQMSESPAEFFTSSDFNNDGRRDSLIIDKAAGVMRIGYQTAAETWTWAPARPAGAVPVTAAAVGRFLGPVRDEIAVTSPGANRVLVHPAREVNTAEVPIVHYHLVGTDALAPLRLPGFGAREQLLAGSAIDPASAPYMLAAFDGGGGLLHLLPQDAPLHRGQPIVLKTGGARNAAFLADAAGALELRVYNGVPAAPPVLVSGGVPPGTHYLSGNFDPGSPLAQVLLWVPGTAELLVRQVEEPAANTFALGVEVPYTLAGNIDQVVILDDPDGPRLLVIFDDGASATVFTFDGINTPVAWSDFVPEAGERFRAATLSGGGGFLLASSPEATTRSQTFQPHRREADGTYTPLASASLPMVTTNSGRANVLLFSDPPFVTENVRPLAALHAGDWTRSITIDGGGNVSAIGEVFGGSTAGLDNPDVYLLGSAMGADEVLANQFEPWLSVVSLRAAFDTPELEPSIAPMPGHFDKAQKLSFMAAAGTTVMFRLGNGAWQTWAGGTVWLIEDTIVSFFGTAGASLRNSALRTAVYSFAKDGPWLDSDHDGIPDFVEIASGIPDPGAGHDTDGDGAADDAELLAGTDPNNGADKPAPGTPRPGDTGITLTATLRSWTAGAPDPLLVTSEATRIDALDIAAARFATRETLALTDTVSFENFSVPASTRFVSLTSPATWRRTNGGPVSHAAQMIAVVPPLPPPAPPVINYVPGGGTPADEALAWIEALRAAEAALLPRTVPVTLSPVDSLVALLIERKVDEILVSRGADPAVRFSLFDTGITDAGARRTTVSGLAALEWPGPAGEPAWRLGQMHAVMHSAVQDDPGSAEVQALRALAADIYERFESVWVPASEADPDGTTAGFPAPLDLLRSLVRGGPLPAGYLDVSLLTPAQIADAESAVATILALPAPRPEVTLTLTVRADSFRSDCTVFDDGAATVSLVDRQGRPWRFQGSIALPPGALVEIRGFTDLPPPPPACGDSAMEVVSAAVQTLPGGAITDDDGDGMGDEWELVFFGSLTQTAGSDYDGDGNSNADEFAAGTDPAGSTAPPLGPFLQPLPVPDPGIALAADGLVELTWECTEECRRTLRYSLECDTSLDGSWQPLPDAPEFLPDGRMRFTIEPRVPGRCFFRVRVTQP